jgi:ubiquinone/menaquinone biosynthesis C-methylase UbiE
LSPETIPLQEEAVNLRTYRVPEVASHYAGLHYLTPCERLFFRAYIKPGMSVLDLGVGGGRTTAYLSRVASRYVGVDYSEPMIDACRSKFPDLHFMLADASDLSAFPNSTFDAIVFSFNGLDYVVPDKKRLRCLQECSRVLRDQGVLIFSSHNPRAILISPGWDRRRVRAFARKLVSRHPSLFPLAFGVATAAKSLDAFLRAVAGSAARVIRRVPRSAFWRGEGNVFDSEHGGLVTHCWTPDHVVSQLAEFDFQLTTCVGCDYPRSAHAFATDWYYYVFSKIDKYLVERKSCA